MRGVFLITFILRTVRKGGRQSIQDHSQCRMKKSAQVKLLSLWIFCSCMIFGIKLKISGRTRELSRNILCYQYPSAPGCTSNEPDEPPAEIDTATTKPDPHHLIGPSAVRIGKCTALFGPPNALYERALRTHEIHNQIHGLSHHVLRESIVDDLWNKPAFMLSVLLAELAKPDPHERLEWLLWTDRDTVVLNPLVPPAAFLPPSSHRSARSDRVHVVATRDWNGLNNGVFLVRVHAWSAALFAAVLAFRAYRPGVPLPFTEQSAMEKLLSGEEDVEGEADEGRGFGGHTAWVPQRWFNAYQGDGATETLAPHQTRRGDFLVHFAGVGDRERRMEEWLRVAERHAPDWELEWWRTGYPGEVEAFWEEFEKGGGRGET